MPADDAAIDKVQADRLILIKPRAGKARERPSVDMRFVELVMARDQARQHAGIGGVHFPRDDREASARERRHPEPAQHRDMRVPGANQNHVFDNGNGIHVITRSCS